MNRIDRIISESINRFVLREIEEGIDDMDRTFSVTVTDPKSGQKVTLKAKTRRGLDKKIAALQGRTVATREYTRHNPKNLSNVCEIMDVLSNQQKAKYISKFIRNEWSTTKLTNIITFNEKSGLNFGQTDTEKFSNSVRRKISTNDTPNPASPVKQETVNPFQKVSDSYWRISQITSNIEKWGAEGDYSGIQTKLCQMPSELENLAYWLGILYNWVNESMATFQADPNRKGNILIGYIKKNGTQAINGLNQLFGMKPKEYNKEVTSKMLKCAELIRMYFGDIYGNGKNDERQIEMGNGNELGITTKRR